MTPRGALAARIEEARTRFKYIPQTPDDADPLVKLLANEWDTVAEFEARGGGICAGYAVWAIERAAHDVTAPYGAWRFVVGRVMVDGAWRGHAWVEVDYDGEVLWADPTWGRGPDKPEWFGYPGDRHPLHRWAYDGTLFVRPEQYMEVAR